MGNLSLWLDAVWGWHCFSRFHSNHQVIHWLHVGGLAYLLQYADAITHTHTHTHTPKACFHNLYLHSAFFLTASFASLQYICTHLVFHLCQHILGPSTPCWALNSSVSLHGKPHNTNTHEHTPVTGETHLQPNPNINLSLSPRQLNISQCKYISVWKNLLRLLWWGKGTVTQCPGGV